MSTLTLQQKLYIAAGANVLVVISLFLKWFGAAGFGKSGLESVPSGWVLLVCALVAVGLLAAQAFGYDLPLRVPPYAAAAYLSSIPLIVSLMFFLDPGPFAERKFGLFICLLASGAATAFSTQIWREEG
jgi:hypothetical protein